MNQLKKKCNVVMLDINSSGKTKLYLYYYPQFSKKILCFEDISKRIPNHTLYNDKHLYITSDEEIKEGDFYIQLDGGDKNPILRKLVSELEFEKLGGVYSFDKMNYYISTRIHETDKKIIATTDPYLSKQDEEYTNYKNLPSIPESFITKYIEEYNKGNQIKEVMVEYEECQRVVENKDWIDTLNTFKQLKLRKDNTIILSKVKDNWSKEELKLCWNTARESHKTFDEFIDSL